MSQVAIGDPFATLAMVALLRRYSMDTNTRVRDLAEYVIETRNLPADDRPANPPSDGS